MQYNGKGLIIFHTGKQILSHMAFVTGLLATFLLAGCAVEDSNAGGPVLESWEVEESSATSEDATAEEAFITSSADEAVVESSTDDPITEAGCSIVEWCDAPGGDGTRCIHQACSFSSAVDECINEGWYYCGTPVCPWIFVSGGTRYDLCY